MQKQLVESIRSQLLELQQTCSCTRRGQEEEGSRKHQPDSVEDEKQRGANRRGEGRGGGEHGELVLNLHAPIIMFLLSGPGGGDLEAAGGK